MSSESREARSSAAFVALTDSLVKEFDLVDVLHTLVDACIDLLETEAGGLLLADADGHLQLMASSVEDLDKVEVVQLSAEAGPCWDCFQTGQPVTVGDIARDAGLWPEFQAAALQQGYRSMHATPMRLGGRIIGSMNLFHSETGELGPRDIALAQALTDVATIAILQERSVRRLNDLSTQLQGALESRIVVEQAKGLLAHSLDIGMEEAFSLLRRFARSRNLNLQEVARAVTERRLVLSASGDADLRARKHL